MYMYSGALARVVCAVRKEGKWGMARSVQGAKPTLTKQKKGKMAAEKKTGLEITTARRKRKHVAPASMRAPGYGVGIERGR
jgi:hypothetical protein